MLIAARQRPQKTHRFSNDGVLNSGPQKAPKPVSQQTKLGVRLRFQDCLKTIRHFKNKELRLQFLLLCPCCPLVKIFMASSGLLRRKKISNGNSHSFGPLSSHPGSRPACTHTLARTLSLSLCMFLFLRHTCNRHTRASSL